MDVKLLKRLNELWHPIYPYLGEWIQRWSPADAGRILELGPFSGGITRAVIARNPRLKAVCLVQHRRLIGPLKAAAAPYAKVTVGDLESLPFTSVFDLVVFRGAFFFLTPRMIEEGYRVLHPGGRALLGGGYGALTPRKEIDKIAGESKELNDRLGKKWLSKGRLFSMVREVGLDSCSTVIEEGGLWVLLKKAGPF